MRLPYVPLTAKRVTGIDSPYEAPEHPELWIDTTELSAEAAAEKVVAAILEFERR